MIEQLLAGSGAFYLFMMLLLLFLGAIFLAGFMCAK